MTYFLLLSIAHFTADFLFQSNKLAKQKKVKSTRIIALAKHAGVHLLMYILLLIPWLIWGKQFSLASVFIFLVIVLSITITHFIIDLIKETISEKITSQKQHALIFAVDQLLHISIIIVILRTFQVVNFTLSELAGGIYEFLFHGISLTHLETVLALGILLIIGTYGISYFLAIVLKNLAPEDAIISTKQERQEKEENSQLTSMTTTTEVSFAYPRQHKNIGRYIGMLERILIIILVVNQALTSITILVAIKSITRFKQFEDKRFAEYYLIGTLFSIVIAICIGFLALRII
ncbi:DUF3307 domain-containing protein [Virgibacillus oceani]